MLFFLICQEYTKEKDETTKCVHETLFVERQQQAKQSHLSWAREFEESLRCCQLIIIKDKQFVYP